MVGENPSEDSHGRAFIEYEERMAAIQAQEVLDPQVETCNRAQLL